jgi:SAM-dependent methyltransferase
MENLTACPICNSGSFTPFISAKDHTVSGEEFQIVSCTKCGLLFTNPRPDRTEISRYYESPDYISHSNSKRGLINKVYHWVRKRTIEQKIGIVNRYSGKKGQIRLLDIGCGTGEFLAGAKASGMMTKGVEPSEMARKQAIKNHQLDIEGEEGLEKIDRTFDVITLWHVLEHVHALSHRVQKISSLLETGGVAIIAVPNPNSDDQKTYNKEWAAWDVPRHLYHFTPETIKPLFEQYRLIHEASLPMKYDAYYVSMLSERYRNGGKNRLLRAFLKGWKSNRLTANNPEAYSSVIYIFRKS